MIATNKKVVVQQNYIPIPFATAALKLSGK